MAKNRAAQIKKEKSPEINQTIAAQLENYMVTSPYTMPGFNLSKMAMDFDMCSFTHFADYFKKETGMTPTDYRAKYGKI